MRWITVGALSVAGLLVIGVGAGQAQRIFAGFLRHDSTALRHRQQFSRRLHLLSRDVSRATDARSEAGTTDYPGADINFSIRLSELTKTRTVKQPTGTDPSTSSSG
jgi:hypothetical protein